MSDLIQVRKDDWDRFMKENDLLTERYETLLKKMKNLEDRNRDLEKKLRTSEAEVTALRQQLGDIEEASRKGLEEATAAIQKRLAIVERLLSETEGLQQ